MKKLFLLSMSFVVLTTTFAQTDAKEKKTTKPVEEKVKAVTQPAAKKADAKVATKPSASKITKVAPKTGKAVAESVPAIKDAVDVAQPLAVQPQVVTPAPPPAPLLDPNKDFEFKNDAYDFGKIPAGKQAKYELFIKNVSKETQELTLVQPGCGCTTPEYTQNQKIVPGETAVVKLGYNGGAPGSGSPFSKSVTVTLKGHSPKVVTFKGETYAVPTESAPANNGTEKLKPEGGK